MDKRTFLSELEKALSVLREDELRDILDEYEQHIDMKIQQGLSEEEAIADFGSLSELTAEILEAYHVRADYGRGFSGEQEIPEKQKMSQRAGDVLKGGTAACKSGAGILGGWCRKLWNWFKAFCLWCWHLVLWPFRWGKSLGRKLASSGNGGRGETKEKGAMRRMIAGVGSMIRGIWRGFWTFVRWCLRAAVWCLRIAWNVSVILFALILGCFGLFCLFGLGMILVLLADGYPLLGVTVAGFGMTLSLFALVFFSLTLLIRKKKEQVVTPVTAEIVEEAAETAGAEKTVDTEETIETAESVIEEMADPMAEDCEEEMEVNSHA